MPETTPKQVRPEILAALQSCDAYFILVKNGEDVKCSTSTDDLTMHGSEIIGNMLMGSMDISQEIACTVLASADVWARKNNIEFPTK